MSTTVSVCIPAYRGKYLAQAIESVLGQTRKVDELIVVDDSSPEDLESIVRPYIGKGVKYIRNSKNYGIPYNYNHALRLTSSDYVMIFGDHDIMEPTFVEKCSELLDISPEIHVVFTAIKAIDEQDKMVVQYPKDQFPEIFPGQQLIRYLVTRISSPITLDTMIRKSTLTEFPVWFDPDYWWYGDIDLWIRLASKGKVGYVNEYVLQRRRREKGHYLEDKLWRSFLVCDRIRMDNWFLAYPENDLVSKFARTGYEIRKNIAAFRLLFSLKVKSEHSEMGVLPDEALTLFTPSFRLFARLAVKLPSSIFNRLIKVFRQYL